MCSVDRNGAHPLHVGSIPQKVAELMLSVKSYERKTVRAALSRDPAEAVEALASNPLVPSREMAEMLAPGLGLR